MHQDMLEADRQLGRGKEGPGGQQVDHKPAKCPHGKGGKQPPGLCLEEHHQQAG